MSLLLSPHSARPRAFRSAAARRSEVRVQGPRRIACEADSCTSRAGQHLPRRAAVLSFTLLSVAAARGVSAAGIEALPQSPSAGKESKFEAVRRRNRESLAKSNADFENSDFLRDLREKSGASKEKTRRALQERYCYRQAELGVGDCGGLRLIPGATKSGKQKTPEWLRGVLKKLGRLPEEPAAPPAPTVPASEE